MLKIKVTRGKKRIRQALTQGGKEIERNICFYFSFILSPTY